MASTGEALRGAAIEVVRALVRAFFRSVEVGGQANVPAEDGGILVAWHPNGLVDPALLLATCPRPITIGARHGLFQWPILGRLMRAVGAVPVYRRVDAEPGAATEARAAQNRESIDALASAVAGGGLAALFPEGVSHDAPHFMELKVGAAKLYYRALALGGAGLARPPRIVPVGLHYDEKSVFRSRALVVYHEPLALPDALRGPLPADATEDVRRARYAALTALIEDALRSVTHPTESWELHAMMHRTRSIFRAERAARAGTGASETDMRERHLGYARVWHGYEANRDRAPAETAAWLARIRAYDAAMRALRLEDAELDAAPELRVRPWVTVALVQVLSLLVLVPPLLALGFVANVVPYQLTRVAAAVGAKLEKDVATIKLLSGAALFPLSWAAFAWGLGALAGVLRPHFPGVPSHAAGVWLFAGSAAIAGGVLFVVYQELLGATLRALRVRLTRARYDEELRRLRAERAAIFEGLTQMVRDVPLPGQVTGDGRVQSGPPSPSA